MEDHKKFGGWMKLFTLNNSPFIVLVVMFVLLPLFFLSPNLISFNFSKAIILASGVTIALMFFIINLLKTGNLSIPKHPIFLALLGIVIVYLLSSLFSGVKSMSLTGYGFEVTTFMFILLMVVLTFLVSVVFRSHKKLLIVYVSFFAVSTLIALFHLARLFLGADFLSFGYFSDVSSNTIGKWNELSIFFGIGLILSVMSLGMLKLRTSIRIGLALYFILSVLMLVVVNLTIVWYVIGAISLILFIYFMSSDSAKLSTLNVVQSGTEETKMKATGRKISFTSLILLVIALVFAFTPVGAYFTGKVVEKFKVNNLDVRPSWSATYEIASPTLKNDPLFGAGPNRFSTKWQLYRPDVNQTNFWNVDFNGGIGLIPTMIIETGILGAIAWLLFFGTFVFFGFRLFFKKTNDHLSHYFTTTSFIVSLYLWTVAIIYMPSTAIFATTFFFTGLMVASAYIGGTAAPKNFNLFKYRKANFLVATVLVLVFVACAGFGYIFAEKAMSFSYLEKGLALASNKDTHSAAATYILRGEKLSPTDLHYRSLAELNIVRLNDILASAQNKEQVTEEVKTEFQNMLAGGIEASRRAQMWDKENYQNWLSVARVYEAVAPARVEGALDAARVAYGEALKLSPKNPGIYLSSARLEAATENLGQAKINVIKALELKANYLEAIFLLSQIDAAQGDLRASANSVEKLFVNLPNDPNMAFRLGVLKYQLADYPGAVFALERAISAVPVYANARYFLGLSYEKVNRVGDAIIQFEEIERTNPDNAEVKLILSNLRAGKASFTNAEAPIDNKPEKRSQLPVEEKTN